MLGVKIGGLIRLGPKPPGTVSHNRVSALSDDDKKVEMGSLFTGGLSNITVGVSRGLESF